MGQGDESVGWRLVILYGRIPKASLFVGAHHCHGRIKMLAILFISDEDGCRKSGGMLLPVAAPLVGAPEGPSCYCAVTTGLIGDAVASRGDHPG
jgi:hypothetical protein